MKIKKYSTVTLLSLHSKDEDLYSEDIVGKKFTYMKYVDLGYHRLMSEEGEIVILYKPELKLDASSSKPFKILKRVIEAIVVAFTFFVLQWITFDFQSFTGLHLQVSFTIIIGLVIFNYVPAKAALHLLIFFHPRHVTPTT